MERILTVAGTEQGLALLQQLLEEQGLFVSDSADNGASVRRLLEEQSYHLVVINAPLADEHGEAIARMAYRQNADVILLVKPAGLLGKYVQEKV